MEFIITYENARWLVDGKRLQDLNLDERNALNDFFSEMKETLPKENDRA